MISPRYAAPVAFVLLLALLPTAIHSYAGLRVDDELTVRAIPETLNGFVGTPTSQRANWGQRRFDATEWIERTYHAGGRDVRLVVVRSFDLKKLYHHPELAAAYGVDLRAAGTMQLPGALGGVHVLETESGRRQVALYALVYDGMLIEDPVWFQLRTAGKLLVTGRKQMTLFFVHEEDVPEDQTPEKTAAADVLKAALEGFAEQKPAAARGAN